MVKKLLTVAGVVFLALAVLQGVGATDHAAADGIGDPKCTGNRC